MKKIITAVLVLMVVFGAANMSFAGDREWATAGKILTGMVGLSILADAANPYPNYGYAQRPARPVYHHRHYNRPYYRPRPVSYTTYEEVTTYPRYSRRVRRCYY